MEDTGVASESCAQRLTVRAAICGDRINDRDDLRDLTHFYSDPSR